MSSVHCVFGDALFLEDKTEGEALEEFQANWKESFCFVNCEKINLGLCHCKNLARPGLR